MAGRGLVVFVVLLTPSALCSTLFDVLTSLTYKNSGVVNASDSFAFQPLPCLYLEPERVTRAKYAWAAEKTCEYIFQDAKCTFDELPGMDLPGNDYAQIRGTANASLCASACCEDDACVAWTFAAAAPSTWKACQKGVSCCYKKSAISTAKSNAEVISGFTRAQDPPTGMRSAVPLGGIAAGSVELRADGTLREWTIVNQSPGGSAKFDVQDEALFGLFVSSPSGTFARAVRTTPPAGVPGVEQLTYSGAHPTSRLQIADTQLDVKAALYGYSTYKIGDMKASAKPAIAFTMTLENPSNEAVDVSMLFNLPGSVEQDTTRLPANEDDRALLETWTSSAEECVAACARLETCASWTRTPAGSCQLRPDVPASYFSSKFSSGVRGSWKAVDDCIVLERPGTSPAHGSMALCGFGGSVSVQAGALDTTWKAFAHNGTLSGGVNASASSGAVAVRAKLAAVSSTTITVTFGWYFPNRDYLSMNIGNFYSTLYTSALDAAGTMGEELLEVATDAAALNSVMMDNSLPAWMQDTLLASLHHIRSAFWTKDGRWRQWEAYDCVNVDSIHNDGERHIPYIMFFPDSAKSKLRGWANAQLPNGMFQEQLACGCMGPIDAALDKGCGRIMSDVSSMFIVYILEMYKWRNDTALVEEMWPRCKSAAQWHMSVSTRNGLPYRLQTTYDILGLNSHDYSAYSSVFQMLAMSAAEELALVVGDSAFAAQCKAANAKAKGAMDTELWNAQGQYWNSFTGGEALMADTLYAQVLAYTVGLPTLPNNEHMLQHLAAVEKNNADRYGLSIDVFDKTVKPVMSNSIWMMAPANHATLLIRNRKPLQHALDVAKKPYIHLRSVISDMWNTPGILYGEKGDAPGYPYITSHYGYHMTLWHVPLAMSGQLADLPRGILSFDPAIPAPFKLPVLLPALLGTLESNATAFTFTLVAGSGSLHLNGLSVGKSSYPGPVQIAVGGTAVWSK